MTVTKQDIARSVALDHSWGPNTERFEKVKDFVQHLDAPQLRNIVHWFYGSNHAVRALMDSAAGDFQRKVEEAGIESD